jgi:hypothetical protein
MAADKASTLNRLDEEFDKLRKAVDGLDRGQMEQVWYDKWSTKDIIAHVMGWEREMTEALHRLARGERPTPEGVDYSNFDGWNERFSAGMKQQLATTVLAEWQQVHMVFRKAAEAVPDDRYGEQDGKLKTANRLLEASGYGHYAEHAPPILEWRKQQGI